MTRRENDIGALDLSAMPAEQPRFKSFLLQRTFTSSHFARRYLLISFNRGRYSS
jgi:hypothetical protein